MADRPKTSADAAVHHGRDLQKVSEQLKNLVASLRSEKERLESEARTHEPAPSAPSAASAARDAEREQERLAAELGEAREALARANAERDRLRERLAEIEGENQRICDDYVSVQEKSTTLAQLFVVLDRIHGALSRAEMLAALQEVVINVVGSEELAVFERRGDVLALCQSFGVDRHRLHDVRLGEGAIGRAGASGRLYVAGREAPPAPGEEDLTAVIPLRAGEEVAGVLAIFRLLGHKPGLSEDDETLFQLLSTHVGLALRLRGEREHPRAG